MRASAIRQPDSCPGAVSPTRLKGDANIRVRSLVELWLLCRDQKTVRLSADTDCRSFKAPPADCQNTPTSPTVSDAALR